MDSQLLAISKIMGKKRVAKKISKKIDSKELAEVAGAQLEGLTTPIQGCDLARLVGPLMGESNLMKNEGEFRQGVLPILLTIPGIIMLKPKSNGNKVIREYAETDKTDKTIVFFILEANWNGKLPTV